MTKHVTEAAEMSGDERLEKAALAFLLEYDTYRVGRQEEGRQRDAMRAALAILQSPSGEPGDVGARAVPQKPVAWRYELATTYAPVTHTYGNWEWRITEYEPTTPSGGIRNLTPLYAAPQPPVEGRRDTQAHEPLPSLPVEVREALKWFVDHKDSITSDVLSAQRNRGNGASEWMHEDDRDFRRDLSTAFDKASAALSRGAGENQ